MAVESEIIVIALRMLFGYFIYQKDSGIGNRLFANIIFMCCGITIMAFNTGNTFVAIGMIIMIGSVINAVVDILPKNMNKAIQGER